MVIFIMTIDGLHYSINIFFDLDNLIFIIINVKKSLNVKIIIYNVSDMARN